MAEQGPRMPKRGDVKKRIGRHVVKLPKKMLKTVGKFISSRAPQQLLKASLDVVDVPTLELETANEPLKAGPELSATEAPEPGMANKPPEPRLEPLATRASERGTADVPREQAAEPVLDLVTQSSEAPPTFSLEELDELLEASPVPTRRDDVLERFPQLHESVVIRYQGSILGQVEKGKWMAKWCPADSDIVAVPLSEPSVRIPTAL